MMDLKNKTLYALSSEVKEICKPLFDKYGITYFNYSRLYPNNRISVLTTLPEWIEYSINSEYQNIAVMESKKVRDKVGKYKIWDAHAAIYPNTKNLLIQETAKMRFQLYHGLTICRDNQVFSERFSFATNEKNYKINESYEHFQDIFKKFTLYFRDQASDLIELSDKNLIHYPISPARDEDSISMLDLRHKMEVEKFYVETSNGSSYLTRRELECINWALQGKTIEESATILNISASTVKTHIYNVKQKLDVPKMIDIFRCLKDQDILDVYHK